jgi:flagellar hook-basal body complex protein FliE
MDLKPTVAARTYADARMATAPSQLPQPAGSPRPPGTGEDLFTSFAGTLQAGEEASKAAMTGGADPHSLVQALAASELAVETAVTLRDKVVEAYQEILRMPV